VGKRGCCRRHELAARCVSQRKVRPFAVIDDVTDGGVKNQSGTQTRCISADSAEFGWFKVWPDREWCVFSTFHVYQVKRADIMSYKRTALI